MTKNRGALNSLTLNSFRNDVNPKLPKIDLERVNTILSAKILLKEEFPRFAIFILSYSPDFHLASTVSNIPEILHDAIEEIFIFVNASVRKEFDEARSAAPQIGFWEKKLHIHTTPERLTYGQNLKLGYRYAVNRKFDYVITLETNTRFMRGYIANLLQLALRDNVKFALVSNGGCEPISGKSGFFSAFPQSILTKAEKAVLGIPCFRKIFIYRMLSFKVLRQIPFEINADDYHFDTQLLMQCRFLGIPIREIAMDERIPNKKRQLNSFRYTKSLCFEIIALGLHKLHIIRSGRYVFDIPATYTKKYSPYSSHEKILSLVDPRSNVLDLGSSNSLLYNDLNKKQVACTCVDLIDPKIINVPRTHYVQCNLEDYRKLEFKREFDYVILADVIEHIRDADGLLLYVRRFLKAKGKIIVSVPNIAIWIYRISLLIGRFNYSSKGTLDNTHVRFYTKFTIIRLLEKNGYCVKDIDVTSLPFEVIFPSSEQSRVLKTLDGCYYLLARLWPKLFAYQFILTVEAAAYDPDQSEEKSVS